MRKRLISPIPQDAPSLDEAGWIKKKKIEVISEEKEYPVESALVSGEMRSWRAADSGTQTIRLIFDEPQSTHTHRARLRRNRGRAHPRVRLAMVSGWRTLEV